MTYAVIPADVNFDFANLDRWYESDAGERVGLFITGSFGNRANMHSVATPLLFFIRVAMKSTQAGWYRGSTNTEPGAAATGCNLQYTNRSMRAAA